jgi:Tol biopolymer transport system component
VRVLVVMLALAGVAVTVGRAGPRLYDSEYRCLIFDGGLENGTILDLYNLYSRRDPRPRAGAIPERFGQSTPDGKYRANLAWNNKFDNTNSLYVYSTTGGERLIQADIQAPFHFHWSPDSHHMAYFWVRAQRGFLTVATPDGRDVRTIELVDRDVYELFLHGWSPDGRYLLISNRVGTSRRFELWEADTLTVHELPLYEWVADPLWSPSGRHLLYRLDPRTSQMNPPSLALGLVDLQTLTEKQLPLSGQADSLRLEWSGDGQWLYAQYFSAFPQMQVDVFGIDGREFRAVTLTEIPGLFSDQGVARWIRGATQLVHIYQQGAGTPVSLRVFNPATGERLTLVDDMPRRFAPSPTDPNRIAVVERVDNRIRGVVMSADGSNRYTVFEGEGDFGDPDWSPNGQYVAFTWSRWIGPERFVNLSWLKVDGDWVIGEFLDTYTDIKELRWLPDNTLAFVGKRNSAPYFAPYLIDLTTAAIRNGVSQLWLQEVWKVDLDPTNTLYRLWWTQWNGSRGMTAYNSAGHIQYQFRIGDPLPNPQALRMVIAPNGATAAIKLGWERRNEMLQLARGDGSWSPVIVSDLKGLGDPVWSPDSRLVAFTLAKNTAAQFSPILLAVYTADGQHVLTIQGKSTYYGNMAWTRCD